MKYYYRGTEVSEEDYVDELYNFYIQEYNHLNNEQIHELIADDLKNNRRPL